MLFGIAIIATGITYVVTRDRANRDRSSAQATAVSHNSIVCVTRPWIEAGRARNIYVRDHDPSSVKRELARQAVQSADEILEGLITNPVNFNCAPLVEKLHAEARARAKAKALHG